MVRDTVFERRPDGLQAHIDAFTTYPGLKAIFLLLGKIGEFDEGGIVAAYTRLFKAQSASI